MELPGSIATVYVTSHKFAGRGPCAKARALISQLSSNISSPLFAEAYQAS